MCIRDSACLLAVSCNRFKSIETPIAGTKNLVTYTAENTSLVGIKAAGAETTLTAPLYVKAEAKYGYLIAQLGRQKADDPVKWALLDTEGQSVPVRLTTGFRTLRLISCLKTPPANTT